MRDKLDMGRLLNEEAHGTWNPLESEACRLCRFISLLTAHRQDKQGFSQDPSPEGQWLVSQSMQKKTFRAK